MKLRVLVLLLLAQTVIQIFAGLNCYDTFLLCLGLLVAMVMFVVRNWCLLQ